MYYTSRDVYEFISEQNNDPIVEWKICAISGQSFPIYQSDLDFYKKISPMFNGIIFNIPTPTLCPEERQRRRFCFRNEYKLYKGKCALSGKDMISMYSPDKSYTVYNQQSRESDAWDGMDYGVPLDTTKSVTDILGSFMNKVPKVHAVQLNCHNSDYTNYNVNTNNCYLSFRTKDSEDIYYGNVIFDQSKRCIDGLFLYQCEGCYACIESEGLYECRYCQHCMSCSQCDGCLECINCQYCIDCFGLQHKQYYINNISHTKEEYETYKAHYTPHYYPGEKIVPAMRNMLCGASVMGQSNTHCKNIIAGYDNHEYEEGKYITHSEGGHNSSDVDYYTISSWGYNSISAFRSSHIYFSYASYDCKNLFYSLYNINCSDCFGCVGLRHKQYCIFNKQYSSKEEYEQKVATIIAHMIETKERGEFLHPSLSRFGYNESTAQDYFPMYRVGMHLYTSSHEEKDYTQYGYRRSNYTNDLAIPAGADVIDRNNNPAISGLTDEQLLTKIYICELSRKPFRVQKAELSFYRKYSITLPRRHPEQRYKDRMALRLPRELHLRTCDKTGEEIISVYAPQEVLLGDPQSTPFKVYSEQAYQQEVFG